ncbi:TPA: replication initiation protein, partial [Vibrio parahaemolyticus]|nr:replication initiation protein [Vibrio parahaemolyticus]
MDRTYTEIPATVDDDRIGLLRMYAYEVVPDFARIMPKKKRASYYAPKEQGLEISPWIQLHQNDRHWVMVDFDCGDEWAWKRLPMQPNLISYNVENGNHQCFYLLETPVHCHKEAKRRAPYKYLKAIEKAIDAQYGGDDGFKRTISKNPFHPKWDNVWIHDKRHTLKEIADGLDLAIGAAPRRKQKAVEGKGKRNTSVFDRVRFKCYNQVSRYKELDGCKFEDWHSVVIQWCKDANIFKDDAPMNEKEVLTIAKSIANFCWYIYKPKT